MELTMLGTGNALVTEVYNTCFVIKDEKKYFMVGEGHEFDTKCTPLRFSRLFRLLCAHPRLLTLVPSESVNILFT